jgi:electron transport complex protein RnfB
MPSDAAKSAFAAQIDALLPQTQCTRCGYPDCAAYALAIAGGQADINRCPPGGAEGIARLSALLRRAALPLDPSCGTEGSRHLAVVDPAQCIGCTLCLQACPVDAIAGVAKRMHSVIAQWCTGCELCLPPCPVDCIRMEPMPDGSLARATGWAAWSADQANAARQRYARHVLRHPRQQASAAPDSGEPAPESTEMPSDERALSASPSTHSPANLAADRKAALLHAAMERARQRLAGPKS